MRGLADSASSSADPDGELETNTARAQSIDAAAGGGIGGAAGGGAGPARGPLSEADLVQLERAAVRLRSLRRAVTLARFHALSMFALALLCVPFAVFDRSTVFVALVLAASGASELRGARLLAALDARGPRWLGGQQLALLAAIAVYCAAAIHTGLATDSVSAELARSHPDLAQMLDGEGRAQTEQLVGAIDGAYRAAVIGFYLTVLLASALYQGAAAYFHFSRAALLRAHVSATPAWVHEAMRRLLG